jgi:hypothetical protein
VAMDRAKAAFTSKDMDDYAAAHIEDVHYLLVHTHSCRYAFSALLFFPVFLVFFFFFFFFFFAYT